MFLYFILHQILLLFIYWRLCGGWYVQYTVEVRNAFKFTYGKLKGKRPCKRPRHKCISHRHNFSLWFLYPQNSSVLVVWDLKELNHCFDSGLFCRIFKSFTYCNGWESIVSTGTFCWTGGGKIFRTYPDWPQNPRNLLCNGYCVSTLGVKWVVHGIAQSTPSSAKLEFG